MQDVQRLEKLLECISELQWIDEHLGMQSGGVHDRMEAVRQDLLKEIESLLQMEGGNKKAPS
jgi:hypothetical protein